jgi:hypothetical protein
MRQAFLVFAAWLVAFCSFGQENDSIIVVKSPSSRLSGLINIQDLVNEGGGSSWDADFEGHWAGVEFGLNGFSQASYSNYPNDQQDFLDNDLLRSNTLNLNILQYSKGIQQHRRTIGLVTGLGLSFQSYRLDNNTTLKTDATDKVYPENLYFDSNQKSKFSLLYLEVPLLMEFQVPIKNRMDHIYFSAGVTGAKRLESHTKIKYRKNGKREKLKSPGNYSVQDYKIAGTVRMGYRWINLFMTYDLVPLFEEHKGPELHPFSAGIRLISF